MFPPSMGWDCTYEGWKQPSQRKMLHHVLQCWDCTYEGWKHRPDLVRFLTGQVGIVPMRDGNGSRAARFW